MFCSDSSNVIRQCNKCKYLKDISRISKKQHQNQTRKHKYLGAALLEIIQIFTHNQKAITHFLQHPSVKENFVYFDAAHSEFSSNNIVTYELTEISDPCFLIYRFLKDISGIFMDKINTKLSKIRLKLEQNILIFSLE